MYTWAKLQNPCTVVHVTDLLLTKGQLISKRKTMEYDQEHTMVLSLEVVCVVLVLNACHSSLTSSIYIYSLYLGCPRTDV